MTLEDIMALHGDPAAMREAIIAYGEEWRQAGAASEREACEEACAGERIDEEDREDIAYNDAIDDCLRAIRARGALDRLAKVEQELGLDSDLSVCPSCGGPADNGHDRCYPPNPYLCSKCQARLEPHVTGL